jgi:hypothetical protein
MLFIDFLHIYDITFARYKSKKERMGASVTHKFNTYNFHQEVGLEEKHHYFANIVSALQNVPLIPSS